MGQMGPVLVSVLFTLNSVTKLNSVKRLCSQTHLDTVALGHQRGRVHKSPTRCP